MNIVHRLFAALCLLAASSLATAAGMATCTGKFANKTRFRGFPYIPVPETSM